MSRADRAPGRRRAEPVKRSRAEVKAAAAIDTRSDGFSALAAPAPTQSEPQTPAPTDRLKVATWIWFASLVVVTVGLVVDRLMDLPSWAGPSLGTAQATLMAFALTWRAGGRPLFPALLTAAVGCSAIWSGWPSLLSGAAVGATVIAALLAIMGTVPAANFLLTTREVLISTAVATVGGLGVAAFRADMSQVRFGYVVLALSLLAGLALVYRLAAGFHGLGRRGYIIGAGAVGMLAMALAYTAALGRWGSPEVVGHIDSLRSQLRDLLGAVPHPIEAALGLPALAWGVFMRARRRQGWWVTAFATTATAAAAGRFLEAPVTTSAIVLGAAYSLVIGLLLGYVVIRIEQAFTGTHGAGARRKEEAAAHRPEPGRTHPLR